MPIKLVATITLCVWFCATPAQGQQLYKCGATFQDKACDTEVQKKYSTLTGSFSKEQVLATTDAQCAELGMRALPIINARFNNEALTDLHARVEKKALDQQERAREKDLISAVFSKKGNATQIRGAIESDCMDKKQMDRRARPLGVSNAPYFGQTGYSSNDERFAARAAAKADAKAAKAAAKAEAAEARLKRD